ncbi:MAG: hypothetical protein M3Q34_00315 [bacterium]|nr:hypothetical protein [bacterium]
MNFNEFPKNGGNERGARIPERKERPNSTPLSFEGDDKEDENFVNKNDPERRFTSVEDVPDEFSEDDLIDIIDNNIQNEKRKEFEELEIIDNPKVVRSLDVDGTVTTKPKFTRLGKIIQKGIVSSKGVGSIKKR